MVRLRTIQAFALLVVVLLLGHALSMAACATAARPDGGHLSVHGGARSPMPDADLLVRTLPGQTYDWLECDLVRVLDLSRATTLGCGGGLAASSLDAAVAPVRNVPRVIAAECGTARADPPDASTARALLQVFLN